MLYKSKINLSLILLIVGLGLIPSGLFINNYFAYKVSEGVSPFLYAIQDEIADEIEEEYLGLGTYDILPFIHDNIIEQIEDDYVLVYGIPSTLIYLRNITLELLPEFINASRAALAVYNTLIDVINLNSTSDPIANDLFFNNYTFQDDYHTTIEGISEYMTGGIESLNYTFSTRRYLINGRDYNGTFYPGITLDTNYGIDLLDWLDFYYKAEADIGTNRTLIETVYNCTWASGQLQTCIL